MKGTNSQIPVKPFRKLIYRFAPAICLSLITSRCISMSFNDFRAPFRCESIAFNAQGNKLRTPEMTRKLDYSQIIVVHFDREANGQD